jgi:hypothetical protein
MFDTLIKYIENLFNLKEPEDKIEIIERNEVYSIRDIFVNNNGCYIVLYFENDIIKTIVENYSALRGDLINIRCSRLQQGQAVLKHETTRIRTLADFPDCTVTTENYCLYLPDNMTIKGTLKD